MKPFVSIITVNYNNANGLEKTIQSVRNQKELNYEFIVVDGESSDNSLNVIKQNDDLISIVISEPDHGIYDAMNKGIKVAKGIYCYFLNGGDCFSNDQVLRSISSISPDTDFFYGDVNLVYNNEKIRKYHPSENLIAYLSFEMICHQAIFVKTEIIQSLGYFSLDYKYCSDYDQILHLLVNPNISFKKIDLVIADFDLTGITNQPEIGKIIDQEKKQIWGSYISIDIQRIIENFLKYNYFRIGRLKVILNLIAQLYKIFKSLIFSKEYL